MNLVCSHLSSDKCNDNVLSWPLRVYIFGMELRFLIEDVLSCIKKHLGWKQSEKNCSLTAAVLFWSGFAHHALAGCKWHRFASCSPVISIVLNANWSTGCLSHRRPRRIKFSFDYSQTVCLCVGPWVRTPAMKFFPPSVELMYEAPPCFHWTCAAIQRWSFGVLGQARGKVYLPPKMWKHTGRLLLDEFGTGKSASCKAAGCHKISCSL